MVHQGGGLLTELITSKFQRQPSACRTWSWARLPSASASAGNRPGHCHTSDLPGVAHAWHMETTPQQCHHGWLENLSEMEVYSWENHLSMRLNEGCSMIFMDFPLPRLISGGYA